jgi:DNA replication ATP-dependent helicase Dna2
VGDHYQLPPLVRNVEAREGGLDISLFKLLSEANPDAVVYLTHQYRMCEEIMSLSNELIYKGLLKCGNEAVAKSSLKIQNKNWLCTLHVGEERCRGSCWMRDLLAEELKACFVNTDDVSAVEERKGDRINNPIEAELTYQVHRPKKVIGTPC